MNDNDIPAVEEAAARLESPGREGKNLASLPSACGAAFTHGQPVRDIAHAAHLTALEVLDAVDAITYPGSPCPPQEPGH